MSTYALLMICGMITFAAFGTICVTGRHSRAEVRRETSRNRTLFIRSFPFLAGFTVLTLVTALIFFFIITIQGQTNDRISKLMEREFSLIDIIFPFIIMSGISVPISYINYKNASIELKNKYPFLIISVLLMAIFSSLTLSLVISLITKR